MTDSFGIMQFNQVRRVARGLLVDGYRGYQHYLEFATKTDSTYRYRKTLVKNAVASRMMWSEDQKWLTTKNEMRLSENPLYALFETCSMSNYFQYGLYFALLEMLEDGVELTHGEILDKIGSDGIQISWYLNPEDDTRLLAELDRQVKSGFLNEERYFQRNGAFPSYLDSGLSWADCIILHILSDGSVKKYRQIMKEFNDYISCIRRLHDRDEELCGFIEDACAKGLIEQEGDCLRILASNHLPETCTQQELIIALLQKFSQPAEWTTDELKERLQTISGNPRAESPLKSSLEGLALKTKYVRVLSRYYLNPNEYHKDAEGYVLKSALQRVLANRRKLTCKEIKASMGLHNGLYSLPININPGGLLTNNLSLFSQAGIIQKCENRKFRLNALLNADELFFRYPGLAGAIPFFTYYDPLGLIGKFIMDEHSLTNEAFLFKNAHVVQALDSIVLYDLLQFIAKRQCIQILRDQVFQIPQSDKKKDPKTKDHHCRMFSRLFPLNILTNAITGQRFLFAYDLDKNEYCSTRLDYIYGYVALNADQVAQCLSTQNVTLDQLAARGAETRKHMWAVTVKKKASQVNVLFDTGKIKEPAYERTLHKLIMREKRGGTVELKPNGDVLYSCTVYQPRDMVPWLLTYSGHILSVQETNKSSSAQELTKRLAVHVEDMYRMYHQLPRCAFPRSQKHIPIEQKLVIPKANQRDPSPLFQPVYSKYVRCLRDILLELKAPDLKTKDEIKKLIKEKKEYYNISSKDHEITFKKMLESGLLQDYQTHYDRMQWVKNKPPRQETETYCSFLFGDHQKLKRPMTSVELCWLRTILHDQKMGLFLSSEEIKEMDALLADFVPLYTPENIIFFDRYLSGDKCDDPVFQKVFFTLHQAIVEKRREVAICYQKRSDNETGQDAVLYHIRPLKIEYSFQFDRFYLIGLLTRQLPENSTLKTLAHYTEEQADGFSKVLILMSDIRAVEWVSEDSDDRKIPIREMECSTPISLRLYNVYDAFQRFMMTFSSYRKRIEYEGLGEYLCKDGKMSEIETCSVRLWYYERDKNEVMTKLRSFGRAVQIIGPQSVRKSMIRRVNKQYQLFVKARLIQDDEEANKP